MRIGIHTDNYRLENRSVEYCFDSIARIGGVNAENIIACLKVFKKYGFEGVLCVECGGEARSEVSFKWLSKQVAALE